MSPFNLGYQAPACKVVLISQSGLHFRLRHDAVNEKTCIFHHATRLRTSQSTYLDIGTSLYVQLDVDSFAVHTNVNDMVLRHFVDLVTGKPLLSLSYLDSHLSSQSAQGNTGQSYLTDAHLAEMTVANLRRLLQMLTDFECPKRLRGIAVGHYRPAFALAPWHAFVAASDGPDIAMAQLAVAALGTQRAGNGTYKDWRPYALTIEEIKSIPLEWYVALVRVVSKWEAKNGNHKLVAKDRQGELIAGKAWSSVAHSFMLEVTGKPGPVHPMKAGLSTVVRSTNVANPATPATTAFASPSPAIPSHPPGRESVLQTPAISEANSIRTPPAEIVGTPRSPCRKLTSAAIDRSSNDNNEVMGAQAEESVWLVDLYDDEEEITKGVADDSIVVQLLLKETGDYACPDDEHDVHIIDVEGHGPISAMSEDEIVELFLPVREAADRVQSALECTM